VPFVRDGITYDADFKAMQQQRTDGQYTTKRAICRLEIEVPCSSVHALIASEPLQWDTQPTAVVSAGATTGITAAKYELHSAELTSGVTLDTVMYSLASGLFNKTSERDEVVQKVEVYSNAVTKAQYDDKRQQFAAQGISTGETWVFYGTKSTDNVHSIMTRGFKVCTCLL
jgi:hypothetical protein